MALFQDQVVLVTGASRGIGRATAQAFAAVGAQVVLNYRSDETGAQAALAEITAGGGRATVHQADVSQPAEVARMVEAIEDHLGAIEVLVNNAGVVNRQPFLQVSLEELDAVFATNVRGVFYLSQLVARRMAGRGRGAIIHVSSILAQQTIAGRTAYAASKGAVESLTRAMALDLAPHGIRVNAVAPGLIRTEMLLDAMPDPAFQEQMQRHIPFRRFGNPDEMADAIVFLASPAARYITGVLLPVDAGLRVLEAGPG
jgi:NAD(P)-dependent dehydrogenase (short-subunit alcohol dehydrogenase family)